MSIDIPSVADELAHRHRERGTGVSVATMTVVMFFEDPAIGDLARERIHTLADKHPSRVIVLDATADQSKHQVESVDWVELGVKGTSAAVLGSAVSALRLTEAPVILLWIAPGIGDDERFCTLSPEAQTVVCNTSLIGDGSDALRELVAYTAKHPELAIADVAYLRLAPWQESIALFFDGKDADEFTSLRRVDIACGSEPEALYLLGWLASRLQWSVDGNGQLVNRHGRAIAFSIEREGDVRRVRRVTLTSAGSTYLAEVDDSGETIVLSVAGSAEQSQHFRPVNNPGIAALVERAILIGQHDRVFQASLAAAGEILSRRTAQ